MKLSAPLNGSGSFHADVTRRATRHRLSGAPHLKRQPADSEGGERDVYLLTEVTS